jgi:hypothetical protein
LFLIPKNSIFAVSPSVAIALQAPNTRKLPIEMISHIFQLFFAYFWQSKTYGNVPDLLDIQAEASKLSILSSQTTLRYTSLIWNMTQS